jgi:hypothetical protein
MTETETTAPDTNDTPKRRPPQGGSSTAKPPKQRAKKRQYARELADLQSRVDMAVRLLRKVKGAPETADIYDMAMELLGGDVKE